MTPEYIIGLVAAFLGGAVLASAGYMLAFVTRLTKVETTLANLCATVDRLKNTRNTCELHEKFGERLAVLEVRLSSNEQDTGSGTFGTR